MRAFLENNSSNLNDTTKLDKFLDECSYSCKHLKQQDQESRCDIQNYFCLNQNMHGTEPRLELYHDISIDVPVSDTGAE